jgi:tRNA (guanine-N7-)-methyltransferase
VSSSSSAAVAVPRRGRLDRIKAHSNPLSDQQWPHPREPSLQRWPAGFSHAHNLDLGCGFGGVTVALAALLPEQLSVGVEIRRKVVEYVAERIAALQLRNAAVIASNGMKFLPHFFARGSLERIFVLFPDPHFKKKNHRRRIVSRPLLAIYAHLLKLGGVLYTITDVKDLADWMQSYCDAFPLFQRITDPAELAADPCYALIHTASEEAKKVDKAGGSKFPAIYRRVESVADRADRLESEREPDTNAAVKRTAL